MICATALYATNTQTAVDIAVTAYERIALATLAVVPCSRSRLTCCRKG